MPVELKTSAPRRHRRRQKYPAGALASMAYVLTDGLRRIRFALTRLSDARCHRSPQAVQDRRAVPTSAACSLWPGCPYKAVFATTYQALDAGNDTS